MTMTIKRARRPILVVAGKMAGELAAIGVDDGLRASNGSKGELQTQQTCNEHRLAVRLLDSFGRGTICL